MEPKTVGCADGLESVQSNPVQSQGLLAGSVILTMDGEMPVEFLNVGDRIITRDSGVATLRSITTRKITSRTVSIKAGSLGHTRPDRDVTLPAGQKLLIRDWRAEALYGTKQALINAERLADGEFVTINTAREITVFQLEFDTAQVIYADGLELASATRETVAA